MEPEVKHVYYFCWLVAVALLLEGGARVAATLEDDLNRQAEAWYELSPSLGWTRRPGYSGPHSCDASARFDEQGFFAQDSAQLEDSDAPRILFLGDSNTFGYCVDADDNFVEVLDSSLPEASAINLAAIGYSSFQGYKTLLEFGDVVEPDVVVVSFNYNDRRYTVDGPDDDASFERRYQASLQRARLDALRGSYFVKGLYFALEKTGLIQTGAPSPRVNLDELQARVEPDEYRRNLNDIIAWSERRGINVVLLMLGDNPAATRPLREGMNLLNAADYVPAIDSLRVASRDRNFGDLARLSLSKAYAATGDTGHAGSIVEVPAYVSLTGGRPIHTDAEYQRIMREVAEEHRLPLVDGARRLAESPGDYIDMCHFDAQGHRKIAELLLPTVRRVLKHRPLHIRHPSA